MANGRKKLKKRGACRGVAWRCEKSACFALLGRTSSRRWYDQTLLRVECIGKGKQRSCRAEIVEGMVSVKRKYRIPSMAVAKGWACEEAMKRR